MVNIGQSIRSEMERQERSVTWFAQKLNTNRAYVYRMLERNSIDTDMLIRVSVILRHNFFEELCDCTRRRMVSKIDTQL